MGFRNTEEDEDFLDSLISDPGGNGMSLASKDAPTARAAGLAAKPTGVWTPTVTRDPALQDRWRSQELSALDRADYDPREYGVGEGIRDYGGLAITGILDALANHGRGLPSLAAQTLSINDASEQRRRQEAKDAGEFALKARGQQNTDIENQLRVKALQQQDQRIGLAGQGEVRRTSEFDRKNNPDNPALKSMKDELMRLSGGRITAENLANLDDTAVKALAHGYNLQLDSANTPQKAADEATVAGARTRAVEGVQLGYVAPTAIERGRGDAVAEGLTRSGRVQTAAETSGATTRAREDITQPLEQKREGEQFQQQFAKDNDKLLTVRKLLGDVVNSAPEGGMPQGLDDASTAASKLPFGSRMNTTAANDTIRKVNSAIAQTVYKDSGASASLQESANHASAVINSVTSSPEEKWSAIQEFTQQMEDEISSKSARPEDAAAVIARRGITPLRRQQSPAAPPASAPSALGSQTHVFILNGKRVTIQGDADEFMSDNPTARAIK